MKHIRPDERPSQLLNDHETGAQPVSAQCQCGSTPSQSAPLIPVSPPKAGGTGRGKIGDAPRVSTQLTFGDRLGTWRVRWGIGRMSYTVSPGLYAIGNPTPESPVFVSANYKMSFDRLRSQLTGRDGWLLVLDTKGINVWCAAGKGTFGTEELVHRLNDARLNEVVSHRRLIVPQLGAPGVSAHEVKRQTGFSVLYGPVRAEDLPAFLDAGMRATPEMRRVKFTLRDRMAIIPVELTNWSKYVILIVLMLFLLNGLGQGTYSFERGMRGGGFSVLMFLAVFLTGIVLTPILLPFLPGRAFSVKGAWVGLLFVLVLETYGWAHPGYFRNLVSSLAWLFLIPAITSFIGMNFTGSSTYTSLSGVLREMRIAVPVQIVCAAAGLGMWAASRFI